MNAHARFPSWALWLLSLTSTSMVAGLSWTELSSQLPYSNGTPVLPSARYRASFVEEEEKDIVWLYGGYGGQTSGDMLGDLWSHPLSPDGPWTLHTAGPEPASRAGAMIWPHENGILLYGGYSISLNGNITYWNDTWSYLGGWSSLGQPNPPARAGAATWSIGGSSDQHYMFGGVNAEGYCNDLWMFASTQWVEIPLAAGALLPAERAYARAVVDSDLNVWLYGGYGGQTTDGRGTLSDLWMLNGSLSWSHISGDQGALNSFGSTDPVIPPGVSDFSMHYINGTIGIFGGVVNDLEIGTLTGDYYSFDIDTNVWCWSGPSSTNQVPVYGNPGSRAASAYVTNARNNSFWIFGGMVKSSNATYWYNDIWEATIGTPAGCQFEEAETDTATFVSGTGQSATETLSTNELEPTNEASGTRGGPSTVLIIVLVCVALLLLSLLLLAGIVYAYRKHSSTSGDDQVNESLQSMSLQKFQEPTGIKYLSNISVQALIGRGNFGAVYKGIWMDTTVVGLKQLMDDQIQEFQREADILCKLVHPNIVQFLGIHKASSGTQYIVMEFMTDGSLLELLRQILFGSLSKRQLVSMCIGACSGMRYLEESKVIHRDLACRNLLVNKFDDKFVVKVSDFGMSVSSDYYKSSADQKVPVRWTAPEAMERRRFSTKSDVWSFAVCVWEIFTYGKVPYPNLDNVDILEHINGGGRLSQPDNCPDQLYSMCLSCWVVDPSQRPSFGELSKMLVDTITVDGKEGERDTTEGTFKLPEDYVSIETQ